MRSRRIFPFTPLAPLGLALVLTGLAEASLPPEGISYEPTAADLARVREQLAHARAALPRLASQGVPDQDRRALAERVRRAEEVLARYERLAERGTPRRRAQGLLYTAGFVLVANDLSGVGALDDVLVPLVGVGLLATLILTRAPPSLPELGKVWMDLVVAM